MTVAKNKIRVANTQRKIVFEVRTPHLDCRMSVHHEIGLFNSKQLFLVIENIPETVFERLTLPPGFYITDKFKTFKTAIKPPPLEESLTQTELSSFPIHTEEVSVITATIHLQDYSILEKITSTQSLKILAEAFINHIEKESFADGFNDQ